MTDASGKIAGGRTDLRFPPFPSTGNAGSACVRDKREHGARSTDHGASSQGRLPCWAGGGDDWVTAAKQRNTGLQIPDGLTERRGVTHGTHVSFIMIIAAIAAIMSSTT